MLRLTDNSCGLCGGALMPSERLEGHAGCNNPTIAARHQDGEIIVGFSSYGRVQAYVWVWDTRLAWWKIWVEKVYDVEHGRPPPEGGSYGTIWYEHSGWSSACARDDSGDHAHCAVTGMWEDPHCHKTRRLAFNAVQHELEEECTRLMERYARVRHSVWRNIEIYRRAINADY